MVIIMTKYKAIKIKYYDFKILKADKEHYYANNKIDYNALLGCIPKKIGSASQTGEQNGEYRNIRLSTGIVRLDDIENEDRYLKLLFVKLKENGAMKAADNDTGIEELDLENHQYVSDYVIIVIDKENNRLAFQQNRNALTNKRFEEYINLFWHIKLGRESYIQISELPDDNSKFNKLMTKGKTSVKNLEVKFSDIMNIADIPVTHKLGSAINLLKGYGGYDIKISISRGRKGDDFNLNEDALQEFLNDTSVLQENGLTQANIKYRDEDEEKTEVLKILNQDKVSEFTVETNDKGFIYWKILAQKILEIYQSNF